ncbi:hypothetical protein CHUAL_005276 [Chamberlinius hualienensis]
MVAIPKRFYSNDEEACAGIGKPVTSTQDPHRHITIKIIIMMAALIIFLFVLAILCLLLVTTAELNNISTKEMIDNYEAPSIIMVKMSQLKLMTKKMLG